MMAGFKADGALAAMSTRAHQILAGAGLVHGLDGSLVKTASLSPAGANAVAARPAPMQQVQLAGSDMKTRAASLAAMQQRQNLGLLAALKINPFAGQMGLSQTRAMAGAQQRVVDHSQLGANDRFSDEHLVAAANALAARNPGWIAHQSMNEGRVDPLGPDPRGHYKTVKFWTPEGMSTEKVYI